MDPATIIAGISAISGLASAMKPAPVQSNSADMLKTMQMLAMQAQQQAQPQQQMQTPVPLPYKPEQYGLGSSVLQSPSSYTENVMPIFQNKVVI
jgi:predicted RecB family nuclease